MENLHRQSTTDSNLTVVICSSNILPPSISTDRWCGGMLQFHPNLSNLSGTNTHTYAPKSYTLTLFRDGKTVKTLKPNRYVQCCTEQIKLFSKWGRGHQRGCTFALHISPKHLFSRIHLETINEIFQCCNAWLWLSSMNIFLAFPPRLTVKQYYVNVFHISWGRLHHIKVKL